MRQVRMVTSEDIAEINRLYHEESMTIHEISKKLFISASGVYKYLENTRPCGRKPKVNAEQIIEINKMYSEGAEIGEIMAKFDIHYTTARKAIKDYKVHKRLFNTIPQVKELNRQYEEERMTTPQLAKIYGVSENTIRRNIWHPRVNQNQYSI